MSCLYMITMPDGKKYVGVTSKTAKERLAKHIKDAKGGRDTSIADAMRRCKFKGITIETLVECEDVELLYEQESEYIARCDTRIPNGHNATNGGRGIKGCIHKNIIGEYVDTTKGQN